MAAAEQVVIESSEIERILRARLASMLADLDQQHQVSREVLTRLLDDLLATRKSLLDMVAKPASDLIRSAAIMRLFERNIAEYDGNYGLHVQLSGRHGGYATYVHEDLAYKLDAGKYRILLVVERIGP